MNSAMSLGDHLGDLSPNLIESGAGGRRGDDLGDESRRLIRRLISEVYSSGAGGRRGDDLVMRGRAGGGGGGATEGMGAKAGRVREG